MKNSYQEYIRRTVKLALKARQRGDHPFGAILIGPEDEILLEAKNTVVTENDITGHAELNLIRNASQKYSQEYLRHCTLYASTEPCPMCAGAIFWSNIGRVVFGLSEDRLYSLIGQDVTDAIIRLPCKELIQRGQRSIEVIGPVLEEEAEKVHHGFWGKAVEGIDEMNCKPNPEKL